MEQKRVGLLVTCLVDVFRPEVGFAAIKLLRDAGCHVEVPKTQTCCGQVAYNSGDRPNARSVAAQVIELFAKHDYVVVPSGSCAGMLRHHYPLLFPNGEPLFQEARDLAAKTYELTSFLTDVLEINGLEAHYQGCVTYHDSCSGKREMGVFHQPRKLLASVDGLQLKECDDHESCCGFGGTFCVKYGSISTRMADERLRSFEATGAPTLLGGDMGCLLNLAGRISRAGGTIAVRHVAEVLADNWTEVAPITGEDGHG